MQKLSGLMSVSLVYELHSARSLYLYERLPADSVYASDSGTIAVILSFIMFFPMFKPAPCKIF
jgi:hypothetical protein